MRLRSFPASPEFWVILIPFILFSPVLWGQALFWGTPALQFHPWHVFAWETLKIGQLPLWNPLSGLGAPLIANYQSALFYPLNWVYFLLAMIGGETAMAWGMGFLAAVHLAVAGVGMVRLVRALGLGVVAQLVSGLSFGLSGYLVARAHFLSINAAVAWLPWILWAGFEVVAGKSMLRLIFSLTMLLLAGHAQTAWYSLVLLGGWGLFWAWNKHPFSHPHHRRSFLRVLASLSVAVIFAVALAAVQLIPTAELLSQSQRSGGADYEFVMTYSFWPWRWIGLLAPGFFGSPVTGDYWGYGNFWEDAVYVGLLPFLLALGTIPFAVKRSMVTDELPISFPSLRLTQFLWLTVIASFLLALGQNTPVFPFLYRYIPTFDLFQAPTRYTIWAVFALALLAGIRAETWRRPVGKKAQARVLRGIVIAAAVLMAAYAAKWVAPGIEPSLTRATAWAGVLGIGAGVLSLYAPKSSPGNEAPPPKSTRYWRSITCALIALDLLIAGWGLNPGISLDFYRDGVRAGDIQMIREGRLFLPADDEYALTFDRYLRFDTFHADFSPFRASLLPNLTLLEDIPSANNFDPLRPARYVRWMNALDTSQETQRNQMLSMMGVNVVERYTPASEMGVSFEPMAGQPRFQWFSCVWPADGGEHAWEVLFENPPDLERKWVVLEGYATNAQWVCGDEAEATLQVIDESPNEIHLQVDTTASGWLFIADTWYPGWTAEVNGQKTPVYRANYLFRAVEIPDGGGEVQIRYRPLSFVVGLVISGIGWLLFSVGWWRSKRAENTSRV